MTLDQWLASDRGYTYQDMADCRKSYESCQSSDFCKLVCNECGDGDGDFKKEDDWM